jgi:hypothetical protein
MEKTTKENTNGIPGAQAKTKQMLGKHNIVSFKQINLLSYHGGEAYF